MQSLAIGTAVTLVLFGLGYVAAGNDAEVASYVLYWQAWGMYQLLPCSVSLTPGEFLCESMAAAKATFFAGIPVGILIYSAATYLILRLRRRAPPSA
jgi:hypothetical protein